MVLRNTAALSIFYDLDSLHKWKSEGKRCIWFRVNVKNAMAVPILAQKGFNFHHAREDFVMMYKWLPEDCPSNLPPASHTNLGVGAMVFNHRKQLLAISEKHYEYPHWKLPGGYVERAQSRRNIRTDRAEIWNTDDSLEERMGCFYLEKITGRGTTRIKLRDTPSSFYKFYDQNTLLCFGLRGNVSREITGLRDITS